MRRAVVLVVLMLAGCGGAPGPRAPSVHVAPAASTPVAHPLTVAGTRMSAAAVAAAASGAPLNGGVRPELVPLPARAFERPLARYRVYSAGQAAAMARAVLALQRALDAGDRPAARRAWAAAYERYLRIGAAYGALGDLDAAITADRRRVERGLWREEPLRALRPAATRLAADVRRLRPKLRTVKIAPLDYATRAHEILEDSQRDLTTASPYSDAGVRATAASLAATYAVIDTLRPLLAGRGVLGPVESGLLGLRRELAAIRRRHGGWPMLTTLTRSEHARFTGRLGAGLEILAKVPGALETQLPPAIPEIHP